MPSFGAASLSRLATCDPRLVEIAHKVIKTYDFTVIQGHRSRKEHQEYLRRGTTTIPYEQSKHSKNPSLAVDIAPWPIDWNDTDRFKLLAGIWIGVGLAMGVRLRWGGDWDSDGYMRDHRFVDMPHIEIAG